MDTPPAAAEPRKRRVKRRWIIPLLLVGVVAGALVIAYLRGTWADATARNPTTSADGIVTQLLQTPQGGKQVRAAVVLDHPPEQVWAVVTDYPNHDKIHRYVSKIESSREADGYHLRGVAHSSLWGDWPYEVTVHHEESPGAGHFIARWDEPSGPIALNRGEWDVQRLPGGSTLLVFTLEIEVPPYPTWAIRNLILDRIGKIVGDVAAAVKKRHRAS